MAIACKCDRCHNYFQPDNISGYVSGIVTCRVDIIDNVIKKKAVMHLCPDCEIEVQKCLHAYNDKNKEDIEEDQNEREEN